MYTWHAKYIVFHICIWLHFCQWIRVLSLFVVVICGFADVCVRVASTLCVFLRIWFCYVFFGCCCCCCYWLDDIMQPDSLHANFHWHHQSNVLPTNACGTVIFGRGKKNEDQWNIYYIAVVANAMPDFFSAAASCCVVVLRHLFSSCMGHGFSMVKRTNIYHARCQYYVAQTHNYTINFDGIVDCRQADRQTGNCS